jgi:hypothetical protein
LSGGLAFGIYTIKLLYKLQQPDWSRIYPRCSPNLIGLSDRRRLIYRKERHASRFVAFPTGDRIVLAQPLYDQAIKKKVRELQPPGELNLVSWRSTHQLVNECNGELLPFTNLNAMFNY